MSLIDRLGLGGLDKYKNGNGKESWFLRLLQVYLYWTGIYKLHFSNSLVNIKENIIIRHIYLPIDIN